MTDLARFEDAYIPEPNSGCWLWIRGATGTGYGVFYTWSSGCKTCLLAHRFSYEYFKGSIPPKMKILHKCDTTSCVNPDHLFIGTSRDNTQDGIRKGRIRPVGEDNPDSRLTENQVRCIRSSLLSRRALAQQFGVSKTSITNIRNGKLWKHIKN